MQLNISKCKLMRMARHVTFTSTYSLSNTTLELVNSYQHLGVILNCDVSWNFHINYVTNNATRMLAYLKRNFFMVPSSLELF